MSFAASRLGIVVRDVIYALELAIACAAAYCLTSRGLAYFIGGSDDLLGGMWAAIAAIFVARPTPSASATAAVSRIIATLVSFALCLPYLLLFPASPLGMAVLLAIGALVMALLGRRGDNITMAITVVVVMAVAEIEPQGAWRQPLLRLIDTVVGVGVGVICQQAGALALGRFAHRPSPATLNG